MRRRHPSCEPYSLASVGTRANQGRALRSRSTPQVRATRKVALPVTQAVGYAAGRSRLSLHERALAGVWDVRARMLCICWWLSPDGDTIYNE
eukprot:5993038-Prymnesium_polylepis.2